MKRIDHAAFSDPDGTLTATAPYNFVALPEEFRAADAPPGSHAAYDPERFSGWIDLTITALTELFIRGTHTPAEYADPDPRTGRAYSQQEFFQPAEQGRIPGSTLRGLARSLVEILTESRVTDISADLMFYRTMDGSSLAKKYTNKMVAQKGGAFGSNVCAGYMNKDNGQYHLYPAQIKPNPAGAQFFRIENHTIPFPIRAEWDRVDVWFRPAVPAPHTHANSQLWYGRVEGAGCRQRMPGEAAPGAGWEEGCLVVSGAVQTKHMHWIIGPCAAAPLAVINLADVIREYEREGLTKDVKDNGFSVLPQADGDTLPCFYKMDGKRLLAIGHTGMMRLPYENTPAALVEHLVPGLKETPGMAERMFGVSGAEEGAHAGFVYFEDALLTDPAKLTATPAQPKVLGEPHPTTFPHYVCQDEVGYKQRRNNQTRQMEPARKLNPHTGRSETFPASEELNHWDSRYDKGAVATPRGTKLFWHRRNVAWKEQPEAVPTDSHAAPIAPAGDGATFEGRARFDNLTEAQLGALLCALKLPEGHAHKVGMGKPYGLGSARIDCRLHLIDRASRYTSLFTTSGDAWHTAASEETARIADYQAAFARWMGGGQTTLAGFWQMPRMRELEVMLRFDKSPGAGLTDYLPGPGGGAGGANANNRGQFYLRRVLPGPLQVAGEKANPPLPAPVQAAPPLAAPSGQAARAQTGAGSARPAGSAPQAPAVVMSIQAAPPAPAAAQGYKRGDKIKVTVLERTGNTGPVRLPNGDIVEGQNTANFRVGQEVNMWVEQVDGNRVVRLTNNRGAAQ